MLSDMTSKLRYLRIFASFYKAYNIVTFVDFIGVQNIQTLCPLLWIKNSCICKYTTVVLVSSIFLDIGYTYVPTIIIKEHSFLQLCPCMIGELQIA